MGVLLGPSVASHPKLFVRPPRLDAPDASGPDLGPTAEPRFMAAGQARQSARRDKRDVRAWQQMPSTPAGKALHCGHVAKESSNFPPHHRAVQGPLPSCANGQGRSKSAAGAGPKVRHLSTRQQRIVGGGPSRRADCKRVASAVWPADPSTRCRRRPMRIKPHRAARSGRCAVEFVPQQFGFVDAVTEREGLEVGIDYFRAG